MTYGTVASVTTVDPKLFITIGKTFVELPSIVKAFDAIQGLTRSATGRRARRARVG